MYNVYKEFTPILIYIIIAMCIAIIMVLGGIIVSRILKNYQPNTIKNSPFECGFSEFEDARMPFDVKFYLNAMLFLIFDLEVAFMIPWALLIRKNNNGLQLSNNAFIAMILFISLLLIGFIYEWKKGALEWE